MHASPSGPGAAKEHYVEERENLGTHGQKELWPDRQTDVRFEIAF